MPFFGVPIRNGLPIGLGSVAGFGVQQFDPSQLFEGGTVAGAWYDPSDLSTLFTTSAGTTPVAMPGLGSAVSVGLMLDKSQGLVLGSELVTNGDFSSGTTTGWTADRGGSLSVVGGSLRVTQGAVTDYALGYQAVTLVIGQWYKLTVDFVGGTATNVQVGVGTSFTSSDATFFATAASPRTLTVYFAATATTMYVRGSVNVTADNVYADFDNFSLKALPGNHAISFNNTTARPELRARVNLLTYSEEFDQGVWTKNQVTAANTSATNDPLGGNTADKLASNTAISVEHAVDQTVVLNAITTFSVYAKAGELSRIALGRTSGPIGKVFDLVAGTAHDLGTSSWSGWTSATAGNFSIQSVGNGWWRVSITAPASAVNGRNDIYLIDNNGNERTFATASGNGAYIWGADLRPANIGANVPAYQRIADANTYDTSGFPLYLLFQGLDDSMYTPANLNLSGTDKVAVFAGVRKLSDVIQMGLLETSASYSGNNGAFVAQSVTTSFQFGVRGTANNSRNYSGFGAPISNVLSAQLTTAAANSSAAVAVNVNGTFAAGANDASAISTGSFGTYPLYIGARNNASNWFNGHLYSLIIAGSAVSAGNISATEQWVAGKTGLVIP
jgi:hypothetical protein